LAEGADCYKMHRGRIKEGIMALVYCSYGEREYGKKPISIGSRGYWEFQCNISGHSRPRLLMGTEPCWEEDHNFWISTPDSIHGWTSDGESVSEIAVFHFTEIPETLLNIFQGQTMVSTRLDRDSLEEILALAKKMAPQVLSPVYTSPLEFDLACHLLSLCFLQNSRERLMNIPWDAQSHITNASVSWYCSHMNEGVGIQETAEKMGYSVSQLRRIFNKTRGVRPSKIFESCRIERAKELLENSTMSIIEISQECGYSNQSSFTRAFRKHFDKSPILYRKTFIPEK